MTLSSKQLEEEKLLAWELLEVYAVHLAYACTETEEKEREFWIRVLKEKDGIQERARAIRLSRERANVGNRC